MEMTTSLRSSITVGCGPVKSGRRFTTDAPGFVKFGSKALLSAPSIKLYPSISQVKLGNRRVAFGSTKCNSIRASLPLSNSGGSAMPIAPLKLESPIGQFLTQILVSHPHLVSAAVDQQLEQLQTDRNLEKQNEKQNDEPSASGTDIVLYRRIAEVKANERRKALEEILYALVVQKFMDADVPLVPAITSPSQNSSGSIDTLPSKDEQLARLHSPEAYEMIQNHLSLILGNRSNANSSVQINKLRVGQVYAASVMYGYFLKRVDQRFQLEKNMKVLPQGLDKEDSGIQQVGGDSSDTSLRSSPSHPEVVSWPDGGMGSRGFGTEMKPSRLRTYVMSFDGETLQRYATIRSKEAINIIEKHTEALFGRPEISITPQGTIDSSKDELIKISFSSLRRLVLEAVTFGSFLWDVESSVDSRYHFVAH
ncbi:PREDICTED: UV-B-induced protein At3g17800, chloroplastic-like isoform X2 [Ipomoea nil]|nr:PREDICTED: UV-B-induced protein At3g17800, chloroplastic-like isoform X2 [Ipomoea nil]